jgi:hypothetical protein
MSSKNPNPLATVTQRLPPLFRHRITRMQPGVTT